MPDVPEDKHADKKKRQEPCSRSLPEARNFGAILGVNQARQQKSELGKGAKKVGWVS